VAQQGGLCLWAAKLSTQERPGHDTPPATSKQQVLAVMANGKYYFHAADWFYPFVGAGIGFADAIYSGGNLKGSGGGIAYQGLAGMEFRFGSVRSAPAVQVSRRPQPARATAR